MSMTKQNTSKTARLCKNISMMVVASVLISSVAVSFHDAFAMGSSPGTCSNRYDGPITAMTIKVGHRTYDPIADPNLTIRLSDAASYTVTYTIQTPAQSSQGNSLAGSTWVDSSAVGYDWGQCINGVGPNQSVTETVTESHPANLAPSAEQNVDWYTLAQSQVTYNIQWTSS